MGTAHLFKVCKIWPPVSSHYLSLKHKGVESVYEITLFYSSGKNRRPVVMIMQALGHAGDHYVGFFFILKK